MKGWELNCCPLLYESDQFWLEQSWLVILGILAVLIRLFLHDLTAVNVLVLYQAKSVIKYQIVREHDRYRTAHRITQLIWICGETT